MELYLVGRILRPHGVRGAVKVQSETSFPEKFKSRKWLYLGKSSATAQKVEVQSAKLTHQAVILKFKGIESPEEAEKLRNYSLFIDETQLVKLGHNQAYIHELIGLQALDMQGKVLGTVTDVLTLPSCDAYQVRYGKRDVLIPALPEFVEEVDLTAKCVRLKRFEEFL